MTQLYPMPFYCPQESICEYTEKNVIHYYVNQDQRSKGQAGRKTIVPNETFAFLH